MPRLDVAQMREARKEPHDLVTASDGTSLYLWRWDAASPSDTAFLIFHGITGYSGPYGPLVASELARAGFTVFGMDLRGHGLSEGRRGDIPGRERLLKDFGETLTFVRSKAKRVVLLGHSLGALNAVLAANAFPERVDGLVLVSVGRHVREGVYAKPKGAAMLKMLLGVSLLRHAPLIPYRRSGMTGVDDPLFTFAYSAKFMSTLFGAPALQVARMFREGNLDSPNLRFERKVGVPILVAVGDQDELFPVESTKAFFDTIDADDKEFLEVPGARHAVFPPECWGPLVSWSRRHWAAGH